MADDRTPQEQIADGYNKAAFDVPYDRDLEAMNDKTLDVELEKSKEGSARRSALQREKEKRNLSVYAGGSTWVDREYDERLYPKPKTPWHIALLVWCREKLLAPIVIGLVLLGAGVLVKCQQEAPSHSQPQTQQPAKPK